MEHTHRPNCRRNGNHTPPPHHSRNAGGPRAQRPSFKKKKGHTALPDDPTGGVPVQPPETNPSAALRRRAVRLAAAVATHKAAPAVERPRVPPPSPGAAPVPTNPIAPRLNSRIWLCLHSPPGCSTRGPPSSTLPPHEQLHRGIKDGRKWPHCPRGKKRRVGDLGQQARGQAGQPWRHESYGRPSSVRPAPAPPTGFRDLPELPFPRVGVNYRRIKETHAHHERR